MKLSFNMETEDNSLDWTERQLVGWTKQDKFNLLQALKTCGSHDLKNLCDLLPDKSKEDIITAIAYYKAKLYGGPVLVRTKREKRTDNAPCIPLASWAKVLMDTYSYADLRTETATALRLIGDFEKFPKPISTHSIDFSTIYHILANAVEGKELTDDELSCLVLDKCLTDTAFLTRSFMRGSVLKYIVDTIDLKEKDIQSFSKPTKYHDLTALRKLIAQKNYNPLRISEEFFKPYY